MTVKSCKRFLVFFDFKFFKWEIGISLRSHGNYCWKISGKFARKINQSLKNSFYSLQTFSTRPTCTQKKIYQTHFFDPCFFSCFLSIKESKKKKLKTRESAIVRKREKKTQHKPIRSECEKNIFSTERDVECWRHKIVSVFYFSTDKKSLRVFLLPFTCW